MTRRSKLTNLTWQGKVNWHTWHDKAKSINQPYLARQSLLSYHSPLNATFSSVRVLMITAEHIESLVECGTWQGEVYWPTWHDKAKYIFNLTWQGEVYWPTWHDKAKYIDLPDMTMRSILTYLTWQCEVYWPTCPDKANILTYLTWQGEVYWSTWHGEPTDQPSPRTRDAPGTLRALQSPF